jgi:primosomal protein N' (replication factor Y)
MALLRAEASNRELPRQFLSEAYQIAAGYGIEGVFLLGPVPAPMERRAGRYRAQLLLQSEKRSNLHRLLEPLLQQLEQSKLGRKVRWSLDVDPIELY